jgi:crossover junction endodeoxyribonuclease RusA
MSPEAVEFVVWGVAKPGPNLIPGRGSRTGRLFIREQNTSGVKEWRQNVAHTAGLAMAGRSLLEGPLRLSLRFVIPRPDSHYNSRGELNAEGRRRPWPCKRPDLSKLERPLEDALKGILWLDDSQIVRRASEKVYGQRGEAAHCEVAAEPIPFGLGLEAQSGWPGSRQPLAHSPATSAERSS